MNAGACVATTVLVNAKFTLSAPAVAVTMNEPTVLVAVKVGAVATPAMLLTT